MKKNIFLLLLGLIPSSMATAQPLSVEITVSNPLPMERTSVPVCYQLEGNVRTALVTYHGREIPCQLDDIDGDGRFDELCFLTNIGKKEKQTFQVLLADTGAVRTYEPGVYAEMLLTNKKIKENNRQNLYITQLTTDKGVNPYWALHHHGAAFESELVGYRIYFDHRQTVDIYGKCHKGLELQQTQFYPDSTQKAAGFGDDVLWVGNTLGAGTLRGWDGKAPTMIQEVERRSQRIISRGPLRTIIEVKDEGWVPHPGLLPIDMTIRYTLYAGHRDCLVDVYLSRPAIGYQFSTGLINVKNSTEYTDKQGLRGCWGTDWPVSAKDTAGHKRETVGLGICLPARHIVSEEPANKDNYSYVIQIPDGHLRYHITFCSANEEFGFHNSEEWFQYLRTWKKEINQPPVITSK